METDPRRSGETLTAEFPPCTSDPNRGAAIFEREEVLRRLNGNEALLVRLLRLFQDNAEAELGRIREAMGRADSRATGRHAHALKGSAANVGAIRVQNLARDMEETAEAGNMVLLTSLVAQTEREFGAFVSVTLGQA